MKIKTPLILLPISIPLFSVACSHTELADWQKPLANFNKMMPAKNGKVFGEPVLHNDEIRITLDVDSLPTTYLSDQIIQVIVNSLNNDISFDKHIVKKINVIAKYTHIFDEIKTFTISGVSHASERKGKTYFFRQYTIELNETMPINFKNIKDLFFSNKCIVSKEQVMGGLVMLDGEPDHGTHLFYQTRENGAVNRIFVGTNSHMTTDVSGIQNAMRYVESVYKYKKIEIYLVDWENVDWFDWENSALKVYKSTELPELCPENEPQRTTWWNKYSNLVNESFTIESYGKADNVFNSVYQTLKTWNHTAQSMNQVTITLSNNEIDPSLIGLNIPPNREIDNYKVKMCKQIDSNHLETRIILNYKSGIQMTFLTKIETT